MKLLVGPFVINGLAIARFESLQHTGEDANGAVWPESLLFLVP